MPNNAFALCRERERRGRGQTWEIGFLPFRENGVFIVTDSDERSTNFDGNTQFFGFAFTFVRRISRASHPSLSLSLCGVGHQFINSHTKRTKNFRFSIVSIYGLCDLPKFKINGWIYFIHCCVLSSSSCMCVLVVLGSQRFSTLFLFIPISTSFAECVYSLQWLSFMWYKWFIGCHLYHFYCHITQIACTSHSLAHNTAAQNERMAANFPKTSENVYALTTPLTIR